MKLVILIYNTKKHSFAFAFWNIICFLRSLSHSFQLEQQQTHKNTTYVWFYKLHYLVSIGMYSVRVYIHF